MRMKIRKIQENELEETYHKLNLIIDGEKTSDGHPYSEVKSQYRKKDNYFIGCCKEGAITGAALGYDKGNRVFIAIIAVSPEEQRKGIGSKILKEIEKRAREENKDKVYLGARGQAEKFYQKQGYSGKLFIQIRKDNLPENFNQIKEEYNIDKEFEDEEYVKITIKTQGLNKKLQEQAEKAFNTENTLYLFQKHLK